MNEESIIDNKAKNATTVAAHIRHKNVVYFKLHTRCLSTSYFLHALSRPRENKTDNVECAYMTINVYRTPSSFQWTRHCDASCKLYAAQSGAGYLYCISKVAATLRSATTHTIQDTANGLQCSMKIWRLWKLLYSHGTNNTSEQKKCWLNTSTMNELFYSSTRSATAMKWYCSI